jgi:hypothetical protein
MLRNGRGTIRIVATASQVQALCDALKDAGASAEIAAASDVPPK